MPLPVRWSRGIFHRQRVQARRMTPPQADPDWEGSQPRVRLREHTLAGTAIVVSLATESRSYLGTDSLQRRRRRGSCRSSWGSCVLRMQPRNLRHLHARILEYREEAVRQVPLEASGCRRTNVDDVSKNEALFPNWSDATTDSLAHIPQRSCGIGRQARAYQARTSTMISDSNL